MTQTIDLGKLRFNYLGAYDAAVTYTLNDVVSYNGNVYCYTNASGTVGTIPTTTAYWTVMLTGAGTATYSENTYYVTPHGTDSEGFGTSLTNSFKTIAYACNNAAPFSTIFVKTGTYEEQLPITIPANVAIVGDGQRSTIVAPKTGTSLDGVTSNSNSTMWLMSDGSLLNKLAFKGMTGWSTGSIPADITTSTPRGIFCALNPASPVTTKSPYVLECAAFGNNAIGAYVNGAVHNSGNKSMLFHEYTNIHDNGVALWIDNGGAAEAVSAFTYYCYFGYAATNGGQLRSVAGNNSYGTYGSVASGYSASETPVTGTVYGSMLTLASAYTGTINPGDTITSNTGATAVVTSAQATSLYIAENAGGAFTQGSTFTTTSGGSGTISSVGGQAGFTLILNNLTALPVAGGSIQLAGDSSSYIIQSVSGGWANAASVITVVLAQQKVNTSAAGSVASIRYKFSLVRLTGHDFLNIGTGGVSSTNYPNTPTQQPDQSKEVVQTFPGRVYYLSTDQSGNFRVGPYFAVNQATGSATLNANAFNLSGLTSLRLGSIGAQLGAQINEFSTDTTLAQNSPTKVPTQSAVVGYVTNLVTSAVPPRLNLPGAFLRTDGTVNYWDSIVQVDGDSTMSLTTGSTFQQKTYTATNQIAASFTYTWSLVGAPSQLSIDSSSGVVSATGNIPNSSYSFTVIATSSGGVAGYKPVTLIVGPGVPMYSTSTAPGLIVPGSVNTFTFTQAQISGTNATHSIVAGSLPSWLNLNSSGTLTGTAPASIAATTKFTFTVRATAGSVSLDKKFTWNFALNYPQGQQLYGTNVGPGTYTWVAPTAVTSVSAVCVGSGGWGGYQWSSGGAGGGGLGWKNNITVVPGNSYTVQVGSYGTQPTNSSSNSGGTPSFFINATTVAGYHGGAGGPNSSGTGNAYGGGWVGDGGGVGGTGGAGSWSTGGGGAAGYTGAGGSGNGNANPGGGGAAARDGYSSTWGVGGGGGVGLLGQGASGTGGWVAGYGQVNVNGSGGGGGSGGGNGTHGETGSYGNGSARGGDYGGGGGSSGTSTSQNSPNAFQQRGGAAGVRLIWGAGRAFPSTLTADQPIITA